MIGRHHYSKPIFLAVILYLDVLSLFSFIIDLLGGGPAGLMAAAFRQMLPGPFGKVPHVVTVMCLIASVCHGEVFNLAWSQLRFLN